VAYVLRIRSNVVLIIASALGYFFFTGLKGFGVEYVKKQYGVPQSAATSLVVLLGVTALAGVLLGGRAADRLLSRGRLTARIDVPGVAILLSAVLFALGLIVTQLWIAMPLLALAAACLGATNPPLDAARLDIMPPLLWGRAEGVRALLRDSADAMAPLLFGFVSGSVFAGTSGLRYTFLVMLISLFAAAPILLIAGRRTYPTDVASAAAARPGAS
jgi:predicted MFS family arabinose efflux permease